MRILTTETVLYVLFELGRINGLFFRWRFLWGQTFNSRSKPIIPQHVTPLQPASRSHHKDATTIQTEKAEVTGRRPKYPAFFSVEGLKNLNSL